MATLRRSSKLHDSSSTGFANWIANVARTSRHSDWSDSNDGEDGDVSTNEEFDDNDDEPGYDEVSMQSSYHDNM